MVIEKYVIHDMIENPQDFPKDSRNVLCKLDNGMFAVCKFDNYYGWFTYNHKDCYWHALTWRDIVAWRDFDFKGE